MNPTRRGPQPAQHHIRRGEPWAAPDDLPEAARELWRSIVAGLPDGQLREGDRPLLRAFVQTALLSDEAAARLRHEGQMVDARPSPWLKVHETHAKTLAMLAAKLRLCVSSRIRPEAAGLRTRPAGSAPWLDAAGPEPAERHLS